jgi:hypothetical protein
VFAWIGPVLMALNGNAVCDANPSCSDSRLQMQRLMDANQDGELDEDEVCALLEGGPPAPEPSPEETPGDGDGGLIWHAPTGPVAPGGPRPGPIAID